MSIVSSQVPWGKDQCLTYAFPEGPNKITCFVNVGWRKVYCFSSRRTHKIFFVEQNNVKAWEIGVSETVYVSESQIDKWTTVPHLVAISSQASYLTLCLDDLIWMLEEVTPLTGAIAV